MNNALDTSGFSIWDLGDWFVKFFASLLMTIVQWGCMFVFLLESVFWAFARGVQMVDTDGSKTGTPGKSYYQNLFDLLLFDNGKIREASLITQLSIYFIIIGVGLVILMAVVSIIRSHISLKEEDHNPTGAVLGVVKAVVLMIAVPFIIYAVSKVTNALIDGICSYPGVNISSSASNSFANKIFFMFSPGDMSQYKNSNGGYTFSFMLSEPDFKSKMGDMTVWETLKNIGFVDGSATQGLTGYNFILAIIVLIIMCIALFKAVLLLGDRMLDLTVLYIVAPLPIACYPSDDGKRYDVWKELIISKLLASLGFTIAFIVYFVFCDEIYKEFAKLDPNFTHISWTISETGEFNQATLLTIVYIVFVVAGGLSVPAVYSMLAQLVGQTAGRVAESDLQNANQDIGHIQRGMSMVGAGVGAAAVGGFALAKLGALGTSSRGMDKMKASQFSSMLSRGMASTGGGAGAGGLALAGAGAGATKLNASTGFGRGAGKVGTGFLKAGSSLGMAGSYFASHGLLGGTLGALGGGVAKLHEVQDNKRQVKRAGQINDLINQAVSNYGDKAKLGALNKQITKMGGKAVDDSYIASRLAEQKQAKATADKNAKIASSGFQDVGRLNTNGQEGKRLAKELNPQIKEQKGRAEFAATRQDAKERLKELKSEKKALKGRKD